MTAFETYWRALQTRLAAFHTAYRTFWRTFWRTGRAGP